MNPILSVKGLKKSYGAIHAVRGVSFEVMPGEIFGVIGPNGSGKTTMFNSMLGQIRPDEGQIFLNGKEITHLNPQQLSMQGVGRTFQTSSLFPRLSVLENVRLAAQVGLGGNYSLLRFPRRTDAATALALEQLVKVGLTHKLDTAAGDISHGDKRKLEIAVLLATEAKIVLLDEPMAGVASGDVAGLVDTIRAMQDATGCTVLMVEHHIDVLMGFVQKVAVMYSGSIIAFDAPQQIMENPVVQSAYLGRTGEPTQESAA